MSDKQLWIIIGCLILVAIGVYILNLYTASCALGIPFDFEHIFELIYWATHKTIVMR